LGDYVRIIVRDTGVGMAAETLARVFEPFFTTKAPGAGSGLGLSQVFGTARQSGGEVKIESEPGQGTKVSVDLPRAPAVPIDMGNPAGTARLQGSRGSILLVDDDPAVRGITATMLEDLGYTVQLADGAAIALQTLEEDEDIDVLMTDLVMPDINGSQLANMARNLRPALPVIIVSGYADPLDSAWTLKHPLIRKPFTVADLHKIVEAALAERRETAG
jgi:CheY-like chemotaxis protein